MVVDRRRVAQAHLAAVMEPPAVQQGQEPPTLVAAVVATGQGQLAKVAAAFSM